MSHASIYPNIRVAVPNGKITGTTQAASNTVTGGVHNGDFAVGSGTKTSDGFVGAESYGWGVARTSAGGAAITATFASLLGKTCMKMVVTGLSKVGATISQLGIFNTGVYSASSLAIGQQRHLIPVVAADVYRISWKQFVESINDTAHVSMKVNNVFYDASYVRLSSTFTYSDDPVTGAWRDQSYNVTAPANAVYLSLNVIALGKGTDFTGGDITWYVTDVRCEKVSSITNGGTIDSPYLPAIQAVTSVDKIDQNNDSGGAFANTYTPQTTPNEGATHRQTFVPTKDYCSLIAVKIVGKGTGNWKIVVHDASNNIVGGSSDPGTTGQANAVLVDGQFYLFPIAGKLTAGQTYHFHVISSVADGTIATNTSNDCEDCSFVQYYGRKTDGILIQNAAGKFMKIDPGVDGLLHNSIIDLNDATYKYRGRYVQATSQVDKVPFMMDVFAHEGYTTNFYTNIPSNGMPVNSSSTKYTIKVNTVFPMKDILFRFLLTVAATRSMKLQYSYDNSSYTDIATYDNNDDNKNRYFNLTPPAGTTIVYIRAVGNTSICYLQQLDVNAHLNLGTIQTLMLPAGASNIYLSTPSSFDNLARDPSHQMIISYARVPTITAGTARTQNTLNKINVRNLTGSLSANNIADTDYVTILNSPSPIVPQNSSCTVSAWVKVRSMPTSGDGRMVIKVYGSAGGNRCGSIQYNASRFYFTMVNAAGSVSYDTLLTEACRLKLRKWTHVTGTYDAVTGLLSLYIDGLLATTLQGLVAETPTGSSSMFLFSERNTGTPRTTPCSLAAVRVWSRAISAAEVLALYEFGHVDRTNLVGEWMLNEGTGTTAVDSSPTGRNGTLTNCTYSTVDMPTKNRTQT